MKLSIRMDIKDFLSAAEKMQLEARLPEFVAKTLAAAVRDKIENNIRSKIGTGPFGQELAGGIRSKAEGPNLLVDHVTNDTNHLAEHVQDGGVIRPKERKYLAIPIDKSVKGERASIHTWATPDGEPLFIRKKEDGPRGRAYLAEPRGKRGKPKFLYVLVRQTKPQRPRPYWPTDQEVVTLTEREIAFWLKKTIPETI